MTFNVVAYYNRILKDMNDTIGRTFGDVVGMDAGKMKPIFEAVVDRHNLDLRDRRVLDGLDKGFEGNIRRKFSERIEEIREHVFHGLPLSNASTGKLSDIAVMLHSRDIFFRSTSGVVIAGFGSKDLYPSVGTNEIGGFICGRLKAKRLKGKSVRIENGVIESSIIPFAQEDMVASFMRGLNHSVNTSIMNGLTEMGENILKSIEEVSLRSDSEAKRVLLEMFSSKIRPLFGDFSRRLDEHVEKNHVQPIMQMVSALPKDELAEMAETLVSLTAFKRRMTHTPETVGGPVDVAVISKGDGLVWVKRKHYFPKELNHHFFANYHRENRHE